MKWLFVLALTIDFVGTNVIIRDGDKTTVVRVSQEDIDAGRVDVIVNQVVSEWSL